MAQSSFELSPAKKVLFNSSPKHSLYATEWKSLKTKSVLTAKVISTPSPLDKVSGGLRERAVQLGLSPLKDQYLRNQSFPKAVKESDTGHENPAMGDVRKCALNKFTGDTLNSFNFSPNQLRELSPFKSSDSCRALSTSWAFCNYVSGGSPARSMQVRNPNKATVSINARTTEILVANKMACELLGLQSNAIAGKRLSDFFIAKSDRYSLGEVELKDSGELVFISGKVMDILTSAQNVIPVSVWAKKIENEDEQRCLVVMEKVDRATGVVVFDYKGIISSCDKSFSSLYGYALPEDLKGVSILELIPSLTLPLLSETCSLPKAIEQQRAAGRMRDGGAFPLSIQLKTLFQNQNLEDEDVPAKVQYEGTVWVFANISGLITVLPDGTIHSCNTNFSLMLFGYTQSQLIGKAISILIPNFYDDLEFLDTDSIPLPPLDDDEEDCNIRYGSAADDRDSCNLDLPRPVNPMMKSQPTVEEAIEGINALDLSPSPIGNNFSIPCPSNILQWETVSNPEIRMSKRPFSFHSSPCAKNASPVEEVSETSLCADSSKQLSFSESQDTLHSMTESDINANVMDSNVNAPDRNSVCDTSSNFSFSSDTENDNSPVKEAVELRFSCLNTPPHPAPLYNQDDVVRGNLLSPNSGVISSSTPQSNAISKQLMSVASNDSLHSIPEGGYFGTGRHQDGTDLAIFYQIRKVELEDGRSLYCLWVSREPEGCPESQKPSRSTTAASGHISALSQSTVQDNYSEFSESATSIDCEDSMLCTGTFENKYTVLENIGKGAFGCVKKSYRNSDGYLVITKFIKKSKIYKDLLVHDSSLGEDVPLEVSLLTSLNHPNIVKVLDVFANEEYIQMVMEKHGSGMDLFEFIERKPDMNEALASYIFRQIVSAISYLHSLSIIHRDIKDENMILNEKFHVKLIDFGSAIFMGNVPFSTFCGTMEYCSPEVIRGEKYRGPELEMWALGVTLYTLIFGEHPFLDVEETMAAELRPPFTVSPELLSLIQRLLEPDPVSRANLQEVEDHLWTNQLVSIEKYRFNEVISASAEEADPPKYLNNLMDNISATLNIYSDQPNSGNGHFGWSDSPDNLLNNESVFPGPMTDDENDQGLYEDI